MKTVPVLLKLQTLLPTLSPAEQQVARFTIKDPEFVIRASVSELAGKSKVSDATVVRACRDLGFDSYQDFKLSIAQDLAAPLEKIQETITPKDSIQEVIDKVFLWESNTLHLTRSTMDTNAITDAVQAIMAADFVYIFGLGSSYAIGYDLQHKLMRAGIKAYAEEDSHFQAIDATNCTSRDVVFAISNSGKSLDIVTNSQIAKDSGATVISLTNTLVNSPLSKISDIAIRTAESQTESVIGMSPRLAQMAVVDTLYTLITMKMKNVSERSRQLDEIFKGLK